MSSGHFHPWSAAQGQSGFTWSWLGAALQGTSLPLGTITVPGYRYHPAVLAQAAARLAEMYPGRFWLAIGSGERLNEHITGEPWPVKRERNARLRERADIMRALRAGETITHAGRVRVEEATLYTRPPEPLPIHGAALTELRLPAEFEAAARFVRPEELDGHVRISVDLERHADWLRENMAMGFTEIYVHNVHREQRRLIEDFGARVLPAVARD